MVAPLAFTKVRLPGGWMSNMSPYSVTYLGVVCRTTEHLFQALRLDQGLRSPEARAVLAEPSPMGAKLHFKALVRDGAALAVEQWSEEDVANMRLCIRLKIAQHPDLNKRLAETAPALLVEDTSGRLRPDLFWGARRVRPDEASDGSWDGGDGSRWLGRNILGQIWLDERTGSMLL